MPSTFGIPDLINEENGRVELHVLKALARRRALADYGALTPKSMRSALREYKGLIPQLHTAWRERNGLPVEYVYVSPFGRQVEGVRRSAF